MQIRILAVAKKASRWVAEAEEDFAKRLQPYAKLKIDLVSPVDENIFGAAESSTRESQSLLKKIQAEEFVIACDKDGESFTSEKLAEKICNLRDEAQKICFVIGGSNGLNSEILARANLRISFGKITFPHELFRVVLLEQIYRSFMILAGKRYHK
jgi:23S rRNA (pseudouridine1915-N3)-methyltransferase